MTDHSIPLNVDSRLREIAPWDLFPSVIEPVQEDLSPELWAEINAHSVHVYEGELTPLGRLMRRTGRL